jgi:tetratricopeptide (TPR) repeat protein
MVIRRAFFGLVLLLPITALPWTVSPLEVNKQAVFYVFATIILLAWLGQALLSRSLEITVSKVWLPFLVFLAFLAVSTGLSHEGYLSVFGQANQEYTSAVTLVLMAAVAFVGAQTLDSATVRRMGLFALIGSTAVGLLAIVSYLSLSIGPFPTNLIGTPNALGVYLLVMAVLGCGMGVVGTHVGKIERSALWILTSITTVTATITLLAIDYSILWALALAGSVALFGLSALHPSLLTRPVRFVLPMVLFVCSLFFLALPTVISNPYPSEVALSTAASWDIARQVFQHGGWVVGTGPGTYATDFAQYHSADLNATTFWDTRFDRGSSAFMTVLPSLGVFAAFALMAGFVTVLFLALRSFRRAQHPDALPWLVMGFVVMVSWFVYPQNFILTMLLWLAIGVVVRQTLGQRTVLLPFDRSPRAGFGAAFFFVLSAIFLLTVAFATVSRYRAEIAFAQAVALDVQNGNMDDIIASLDTAASANRWSDVAYRNLASALLAKVSTAIQDKNADPEYVKSLIGAAVNAGVRATDLGPTNVTNWELRGDVYREVAPLVADAATFSVAAYQQAVSLSPTNPRYLVGLSRGYLAVVDVLTPIVKGDDKDLAAQAEAAQTTALQSANDALLKAITLKSDYAEARYYLASVQERENKLADAVASMEIVRAGAPNDVGVGLQLSLLYLRQGKNDLAKKELERIIALAPNFANAHWYLASVLEEEKDMDGALIELETIMKLDPKNETVQKKIDALKAGQKPTETIPDPLPMEGASITPTTPTVP